MVMSMVIQKKRFIKINSLGDAGSFRLFHPPEKVTALKGYKINLLLWYFLSFFFLSLVLIKESIETG